MDVITYEFLNYFVSVVTGLAFLSVTINFYSLYKNKRSQTLWRIIGFGLLSALFFFYILERKFPGLSPLVATLELFSYLAILLGIILEPSLKNITITYLSSDAEKIKINKKKVNIFYVLFGVLFIAFIVGSVLLYFNTSYEVPVFFVTVISLVIIGFISFFQIRRYLKEKNEGIQSSALNFGFVLSFIFLFLRQLAIIFNHIPFAQDISWIRQQNLDYSLAWWFIDIFTLVSIGVFLRFYLTYIFQNSTQRIIYTLITVSVIVSTTTLLILSSLIYTTVSNTNKDLVDKGSRTLNYIMVDRASTSQQLAQSLSTNKDIVDLFVKNDTTRIQDTISVSTASLNSDFVRIYNAYGEVITLSTDQRDLGNLYSKDQFVMFALKEKRTVRTFDLQQGLLAPIMVVRSIYPVINGQTVLGAIEVGYKFDNAFADRIKKETGLEVTIYSNLKRSATTIIGDDGVSRWTGSLETDSSVIDMVSNNSKSFLGEVRQLSRRYFASYLPILNINGEPVGMVAALSPFDATLEDIRQQVLTSALIITNLSLLSSFIGYFIIRKGGLGK